VIFGHELFALSGNSVKIFFVLLHRRKFKIGNIMSIREQEKVKELRNI